MTNQEQPLTEQSYIVENCPVIADLSTVMFPKDVASVTLSGKENLTAVRRALANDGCAFFTNFTKPASSGNMTPESFCGRGTYVRIRNTMKSNFELQNADNRVYVSFFVIARAELISVVPSGDGFSASVILLDVNEKTNTPKEEAYARLLKEKYEAFEQNDITRAIVRASVQLLTDLGEITDTLAARAQFSYAERRTILELTDRKKRAEKLLRYFTVEGDFRKERAAIEERVNDRTAKSQREYYLRETIREIKKELGEEEDYGDYEKQIRALSLPEETEKKLLSENSRLQHMQSGSPDYTVLSNYLETVLAYPWNKTVKEKLDFRKVQEVLDADHNALEDVKDRIVEYIAAKQYSHELKSQILCLVGPPGVGKTSIASSIAKAMGRKFVRISLGGVRDEADIRGHRKTYVAAMPGRIIEGITQSGSANPFVLLDEVDKMGQSVNGDPTAALLEVLDSEQNHAFRDHFMEVPVDLSDVFFLATANYLPNIPKPLRDRMEIIELNAYTREEKRSIARDHLVPKQLKKHGIKKTQASFTDGAIYELIDYYTSEAGVRTLERNIASICRKIDKKLLDGETKKITVKASDIEGYLGARKNLPEKIADEDSVGVVNGLAFTEVGGSLLPVEVSSFEGTGQIKTTGSLGNVIKESSEIAVSVVRSIAKQYGIEGNFYKEKDLHIHFPEGAVPKDGPSAGVTMVTALVSELSGRPVHREIAMTGEINLKGKVLPIGGLKEKTMAAYTAGVRRVLIPKDNVKDLEKIDKTAKAHLEFIPCATVHDVLKNALC